MNKREKRINLVMRFVVAILGVPIILGLTLLGTFALQIALGVCLGWVAWDIWSAWWGHRCRVRERVEAARRPLFTTAEMEGFALLYLDGIVKRDVQ